MKWLPVPSLLCALLIQLVAASNAEAEVAPLNSNDIGEIKRVCRKFFGAPAKDMESVLRPLTAYFQSPNELTKHNWVCSSQHCSGRLELRDGSTIVYGFISIPDPASDDPMDITPDRIRKGNNRINAVGLVKKGKVIFAIPADSARFLVR